jgi:hypothetical protein
MSCNAMISYSQILVCGAPVPKVETSAAEAIASRKRISAAAQKPTRTKHQPGKGKAKTKAGSPRESRQDSKQARVLAMLGRAVTFPITLLGRADAVIE